MNFLKKVAAKYKEVLDVNDFDVGDKVMRIAGKTWMDSQVVIVDGVRVVKELNSNKPLILEVLKIHKSEGDDRLKTRAGWLMPEDCVRVYD